jgi:hypothetical protein
MRHTAAGVRWRNDLKPLHTREVGGSIRVNQETESERDPMPSEIAMR